VRKFGIVRNLNKLEKWADLYHECVASIVVSAMAPITKMRVDSNVVVVMLKETPSGFQVKGAESLPILSRPIGEADTIRERGVTIPRDPKTITCFATFHISRISAEYTFILNSYTFPSSMIVPIQESALREKYRQAEWITKINRGA
jgi:hypothetical protein